jgi:5-methylcytosine-specific restriction enzyme subunit McrC
VSASRIITLTEYRPLRLLKDDLDEKTALALWERYGNRIAIEFPSPKTDGQWELTSLGWIGHIPVDEGLAITLRPKVPVGRIFEMLDYAYGLRSFKFLDGSADMAEVSDLYESLAHVLALRIIARVKKGLYRSYVARREHLGFVRGRLDVRHAITHPWQTQPLCDYELHTTDVEENQILAWALHLLTRAGLQRDDVRITVRRAHRVLKAAAEARPFSGSDCIARTYNRLNDDYRPLHALSRFFLDNTAPTFHAGRQEMLPFILDMAALFEKFVEEWLRRHLPEGLSLKAQHEIRLSNGNSFRIDLVLYRKLPDGSVVPVCVMDTKYKAPDRPSTADVAQVVAYAVAVGCHEAFLVYPTPIAEPLDDRVGDVRVRTVVFDLERGLEDAGSTFAEAVIGVDWRIAAALFMLEGRYGEENLAISG